MGSREKEWNVKDLDSVRTNGFLAALAAGYFAAAEKSR